MIIRPEQWLSPPDLDRNGLLKAWVIDGNTEFPIPIETHNVDQEDVLLSQDQGFELILECAEKPDVYQDADAFLKGNEHHSLAPESVIPIGLFSPPENARILLNGVVARTYPDPADYGFEEDDILLTISCLGNRYDIVLPAAFADGVTIYEGNTVSCVYWVQGWPERSG